jgi:hypothetical protein
MRFIRKTAIGVVLLLVLWIGAVVSGMFPRLTDVQRKSLAIIEAPRTTAVGERNAFEAIWLAQYAVPPDRRDQVMADDLRNYDAWSKKAHPSEFQSDAEGRWVRTVLRKDLDKVLCRGSEQGCLAKVRRDLAGVKTLIAENAAFLERIRALAAYDHVYNLFPRSFDMPMASTAGFGMLWNSDAAKRFAEGDRAEGLARACVSAATWRRFALRNDDIVSQMVAARYFEGAAGLVGEMLAELPAGQPLPAECAGAFAPLQWTGTETCDAMKGEFVKWKAALHDLLDADSKSWREVSNSEHSPGRSIVSGTLRLGLKERATVATVAAIFASACTHDSEVQAEALRLSKATKAQVCGVQGGLFNPAGCAFAHAARPSGIERYFLRFRNMVAVNDLVRASLAMRRNATMSPTAGIVVDRSTMQLRIERPYVSEGDAPQIVIPLPASRLR